MAKLEQVNLLNQGYQAWNAWRATHKKTSIDLRYANLNNADLSGANLQNVNLSGASLKDANLSMAHMNRANRRVTKSANLSGTNLSGAELSGAGLTVVNMSGADLSGAYLIGADLSAADLSGADLSRTDLSVANLSHAILNNTNFLYARAFGTLFTDLDLREANGLETIKHQGPSSIGTDTIMRSEGDIPDVFLRGAGLSDTFIDYIRALAKAPIEYYTCFISYSSQDQDFAERLYADLQNHNVRCWYAPEDLKIGDKFRKRIDESIRMYDKLLLVLSEHSVKSSWVETEVETAFAKERNKGCLTLFPLKLDDTVTKTEKAWASNIQHMRHIGDFTHWKDHDAYQRSFKRVLRDLSASTTTKSP